MSAGHAVGGCMRLLDVLLVDAGRAVGRCMRLLDVMLLAACIYWT